MASLSKLDICNRAIGRLPAKPIASIDENSLEARECRRFYPMVIADMLDGPHDWSFAIQRVRLAVLATNDRDAEWAYAYQLPSNLGNTIRLLPDLTSLGLGIPAPLPGEPYAETWVSAFAGLDAPFETAGQMLYANAIDATLEYTISDVVGVSVPQLAMTAVEIDLASRLAVPVKKDSAREKDLISQTEVAWQRAIADDMNRQPTLCSGYLPEAIAARHGIV